MNSEWTCRHVHAFLQVAAQIRQTIKAAHDAGGVWEKEETK